MGQRPRSRLDLVVPDMNSKVQMKQQTQKFNHDRRARSLTLQVGDKVNIHNFPAGNGWLPGIIEEETGPLSFRIKLQDGQVVRRHIDHIIYRSTSQIAQMSDDWLDLPQISESNTTQ